MPDVEDIRDRHIDRVPIRPARGRRPPAGPIPSETTPMKLPPQLGPIHFIGIGGIGMSGIAEVMHNLGYTVQGSDASDNYNVRRLAEKGVKTFIGHDGRRTWTTPRSSSCRPRSSATIPSSRPRASSACRSCAAPRCWPS